MSNIATNATKDATLTRTREIVVEEVFPHTPDVVWKTLTTSEMIGRWLMKPAGFEATVGKRFTFSTTPAGEWDGTIHCQVLEAVPNERLVYAWQGGHESNTQYGSRLDTRVAWTLTRVDGGTKLRLEHSGFVEPRNDTAYDKMNQGWKGVFRKIDAVANEQEQ